VFERFTAEARRVVARAQDEALSLGHNYVGTEHLLLGLFGEDTVASRAMESVGLTRAAVTGAVRAIVGECPELAPRPDPDALAAVGIDLEVVRRSIEASFGPGALEGTCAWQRGRGRRFTPPGQEDPPASPSGRRSHWDTPISDRSTFCSVWSAKARASLRRSWAGSPDGWPPSGKP
jgi:hypothetical protein